MKISSFEDLEVYRLAMEVVEWLTQRCRHWPAHERSHMVAQILDCARSVGAGIAEAWRRRLQSAASWVSKLSECESEASETINWLLTAHKAGYISPEELRHWRSRCISIIRKLSAMRRRPEKWCPQEAFRPRGSSHLGRDGRQTV